jgi:two-component system, cell cycle sensor histidine kinase and response regulator CckA
MSTAPVEDPRQTLLQHLERERRARLEAEAIAERALRELQAKSEALNREVSERRKVEAEYRQSQKMEAMGVLAGGVAHDFNNLLTVINGYSEVVGARLPPDSPLQDMIRQIAHAGERAALLTQQLLVFSRKQALEPKVINLNAIVTDVAKLLRRLIGEDIELKLQLDEDLAWLRGDPGQLGQVLLNLAINARDAMPDGGVLTVKTGNADLTDLHRHGIVDAEPCRYVRLEVSDTGCGMDEVTRARAFEPFFTTKEPGKGTGLGLATVYGAVRQSGGHIALASAPGWGAAFRLYFPIVEGAAADQQDSGVRRILGGTETVLLVEDEQAVCELARYTLETQGYVVLEARNGEEAMRIANTHPDAIDLLVTDLVMPGIGGRILAQRLRDVRGDVKVLYMSGYAGDVTARHRALLAPASFLQKPFAPRDLLLSVRAALASP